MAEEPELSTRGSNPSSAMSEAVKEEVNSRQEAAGDKGGIN